MSLIGTLQDLVRIPSLSGHEKQAQEYIKANLGKSHLKPFFQGENLVVHLEGQDRTRAFIFNSHVDVVDAGDESRWTQGGPWSGMIKNGRMYGRGTSDMKAGVWASMELAKRLGQKDHLPCDLWFTYVVQEETDGSGTRSFAEWFRSDGKAAKYKEKAAIFTEPTSLTSLEYGHRGNYFIRAKIEGDAGHASRPHALQQHAILTMVDFIADLAKQMKKWEKRFPQEGFIAPTITPTAIEAKNGSPNRVSDLCVATFDLRTIPKWDEEAFIEVKELADKRDILLSLIYPSAPTGYTKPDAKIIQIFQRLIPNLELTVSQASADLGFLTKIGVEGVIFGPGEKELSHAMNESVSIDQVLKAPEIYQRIYERWATGSS